jgi:hypothetical protein
MELWKYKKLNYFSSVESTAWKELIMIIHGLFIVLFNSAANCCGFAACNEAIQMDRDGYLVHIEGLFLHFVEGPIGNSKKPESRKTDLDRYSIRVNQMYYRSANPLNRD